MKKHTNYKNILSLGATAAVTLGCTMMASAAAFTLSTNGNIDGGSGWTDDLSGAAGEPTAAGDTGLISGNGNYNSANWVTAADILMTSGDINGTGTSQNFNFGGGGSFTMTGGTFNSRGILANGSDISLLGGVWTVGNLTTGSGVGTNGIGTLTIGGDFVLLNSRPTAHNYGSGDDIVFNEDWTGSWTNSTVDLDAWRTELTTAGKYSLGSTAIDTSVFDANFQVVGNTLSLIPEAVPEPSSTALLGLGGLAFILRRRK